MEHQVYYKKQRQALLNDPRRKQLFKNLFEVYANKLPLVLKNEDGTIKCIYPESVELAADKVRQQIIARDQEVFNSVKV